MHVKLLFGTLGHFKGPLKNPLTVTRFFEILTFGFAKQYELTKADLRNLQVFIKTLFIVKIA